MGTWKDATGWGLDEEKSEPRVWLLDLGKVNIRLHRHVQHDAEEWLITCRELSIERQPLGKLPLEEARTEALRVVSGWLQAAQAGLEDHMKG
jgi:hypothetical protein